MYILKYKNFHITINLLQFHKKLSDLNEMLSQSQKMLHIQVKPPPLQKKRFPVYTKISHSYKAFAFKQKALTISTFI